MILSPLLIEAKRADASGLPPLGGARSGLSLKSMGGGGGGGAGAPPPLPPPPPVAAPGLASVP